MTVSTIHVLKRLDYTNVTYFCNVNTYNNHNIRFLVLNTIDFSTLQKPEAVLVNKHIGLVAPKGKFFCESRTKNGISLPERQLLADGKIVNYHRCFILTCENFSLVSIFTSN